MTLDEYQAFTHKFAFYPDQRKLPGLFYAILALGGESGELQNKLKKAIRVGVDPDPMVLADELGDVLWYVAAVARELGMSLSSIAAMNLNKLEERKKCQTSV